MWTEERIVQAFQAFEARYGRQPTYADSATYAELPSHGAVQRCCGSWPNACVLAGQVGWMPGGHSRAKDEETEKLMKRVEAGETLTDVGRSVGCTGQALGRRIARYRKAFGLEPLLLSTGRRSPK